LVRTAADSMIAYGFFPPGGGFAWEYRYSKMDGGSSRSG
jgi:hypothetical protein